MGWQGHLDLHYRRDGERTIALDRHHGPLRVLQRLYPEGPAVCHHVLVHPPGGIVGGDELRIDLRLEPGTHALVTTPGATRFYRSAGELALQQATLQLAEGARLEWLPLEAIAYRGCEAENRVHCELAAGAQMIGWDLLALGLPAAGQAFDRGRYLQQLSIPGVWLERGRLDGRDTLLLDSPLGLAGHRVLGSLWLASGTALGRVMGETLVDAARALIDVHPLARQADATPQPARHAGVTQLHEQAVVLRVLADRVEPAMQLLQAVWAAWRPLAWGLGPVPPRVWRT